MNKRRHYSDERHKVGHSFIVHGSSEHKARLPWPTDAELYEDLRLRLGIFNCEIDFAYGKVKPFEVGTDRTDGVKRKPATSALHRPINFAETPFDPLFSLILKAKVRRAARRE